MFPGVKRFQNELMGAARERFINEGRAYVRAPSGRLHIVSNEDDIYKLCNYLIQGTAADVLKEKMVALDSAGFGDMMVLPIHDEVIFDFPADQVEELTKEAARIMTNDVDFLVPLDVDASEPLEQVGRSECSGFSVAVETLISVSGR